MKILQFINGVINILYKLSLIHILVDTVATVTLEKAIALARTELTALLKVLFIFVSSFYFV